MTKQRIYAAATGLPTIRRRAVLGAIASAPLVALPACAERTEIQRLYLIWWNYYAEYFAYDAKWQRKEITSTEYEAYVNPILDASYLIEDQIFAAPSQTILDLAIKCNISALFDWGVFHMQDGLIADAERLAGKVGPEMAAVG